MLLCAARTRTHTVHLWHLTSCANVRTLRTVPPCSRAPICTGTGSTVDPLLRKIHTSTIRTCARPTLPIHEHTPHPSTPAQDPQCSAAAASKSLGWPKLPPGGTPAASCSSAAFQRSSEFSDTCVYDVRVYNEHAWPLLVTQWRHTFVHGAQGTCRTCRGCFM